MAGIYFHIPFCKARCLYCNFFSSVDTKGQEEYVKAMCSELQDRKDYLNGLPVKTIYFGGGTPSQLSIRLLENIFRTLEDLKEFYTVHPCCEITLEANPDDITPKYLKSLQYLQFNRISFGVQSFNDEELHFLNRRHDAQTVIRTVQNCRENGFSNISIDLMYGLPNQSLRSWEKTIQQAIELDVPHISAYHLTYEVETPLFDLWQQKKIYPIDEELSVIMFETLINQLTEVGYEHYEISNFARSGYQSRHNSSYWNGTHYLGIGVSAHSYNGISRQWNKQGPGATSIYREQGAEMEILDEKTRYNDFILTRLRTMKGINLQELQSLFGEQRKVYCMQHAEKYISNFLLEMVGSYLRLTRKGIFIADGIIANLMITKC